MTEDEERFIWIMRTFMNEYYGHPFGSMELEEFEKHLSKFVNNLRLGDKDESTTE